MNTKQLFSNVTGLKAAVSTARQDAKAEAQRDCGRGTLISRGAWIRSFDAKGEIIQGEAESWEFLGTAKQFAELADILRYDAKVASITIEGGWNWAVNPTAYADCDYDAWVSEWTVAFGSKEEEPAPAPVAPAPAAAPGVLHRTPLGYTVEKKYGPMGGTVFTVYCADGWGLVDFCAVEPAIIHADFLDAKTVAYRAERGEEKARERALHLAHKEGYEAGMDGALSSANPYEPGSPVGNAWDTGLLQARSVQREQREAGFA